MKIYYQTPKIEIETLEKADVLLSSTVETENRFVGNEDLLTFVFNGEWIDF